MRLRTLLHCSLIILFLQIASCTSAPPRPTPPAPAVGTLDDLTPDQRARIEREQQIVQTQMAILASQFAQQERQRIEAQNQRTQQRFTGIERAGGLRPIIEQELTTLRAQLAQSPPTARAHAAETIKQINTLATWLGNIAFCTSPMVFDETSSSESSVSGKPELLVEPRVFALIEGCHFGTTKGEVHLVLPGSGETLLLNVINWRDDSITVDPPAQSGRVDQPAQLVVIAHDGTQSPPLDVQFHATRVWTFLDPVAHSGVLFVDCGHNTTTDSCGARANKGPPLTLFAAANGGHFTFCCSSVSGTDRWVLSLRNGWVPQWLVYDVSPAPDMPYVYYTFDAEGYRTCNFFNREGKVTDYKATASADPRFQGEVDISWWVDHSCSGIEYVANFAIVGPIGVPYWE